MLLLLCAAVLGLSAELSLWPYPSHVSLTDPHCLYVDPHHFQMSATPPSTILTSAFTRYQHLSFPNVTIGQLACQTSSSDSSLHQLSVHVSSTDDTLGPNTNESYTLKVSSGGAVLEASTIYGALRGLETFSQLISLRSGKYVIPQVSVIDEPRWGYRSIMIDTARMFRPVPLLKQMMDAMTYNKFNVLNLHLTDDDNWPVEIKAYPKLALNCSSNHQYYTQENIKDLVAYAKERGIRVIAEIDSPSHFNTEKCYPDVLTLAKYPCPGAGPGHGTFRSTPDPSNPDMWKLLTDVFTELTAILPDPYWNVGGDEAWLNPWNCSDQTRNWMSEHHLSFPQGVATYYENEVLGIAAKLSKRPMGWSPGELDGTTASNVIHLVWSGWRTGSWETDFQRYTKEGQAVILSGPWYLDQNSLWSKFYQVDPDKFTGTTKQHELVLGGMGTIWSDLVKADILTRAWPLMDSVGEVLWSPESVTTTTSPPTTRYNDQHERLIARGLPV